MKRIILKTPFFLIMIFAFNFCKDNSVVPPPENEINKPEYNSNSSYSLSLVTSDSENLLELDIKNHLLYQEKFNVHSNLSSKLVSGSLTFNFDEGKE